MKVTASQLRQDIYRLLDMVIETGEFLEIMRKGTILTIKPPAAKTAKLNRLKKRILTTEDSDNFIHLDWSKEWKHK